MSDFLKHLKKTWDTVADPKKIAHSAKGAPLVYAVKTGNFTRVEELKAKGYDLNSYSVTGQTPFHEALAVGNIRMAQHLVKLGANPLLPLKEPHIYKNPIHLAIHKNIVNAIGYLKALGFGLNEVEENGWTPLDHAVNKNNPEMVKALIEAGADPLLSSQNNRNIAVNAVADRKTDVVKALLLNPRAHAAFSDAFYKQAGVGKIDPPLIMAASRKYHEITKLILSCGFNINQRDAGGRTPLHHAVLNQDIDLLKGLLKRGADINDVKDKDGMNPFHLLCMRPQTSGQEFFDEAFELFLDYGADINCDMKPSEDKDGMYLSVLDYALCNRLPEVAGKFLDAGADPWIQYKSGKSLYELGINSRDANMAQIFRNKVETRSSQKSKKAAPK